MHPRYRTYSIRFFSDIIFRKAIIIPNKDKETKIKTKLDTIIKLINKADGVTFTKQ